MAKGSQLTQLKSALSQAGVTRQPQSGKKRKRASAEQDKEKKATKLNEIHQKLNPFDVKVTKLKHDVGGRKLKGVTGRPAQSRQAGLEQRKKTLLKEYEEKNRSGGILDRRFGENDPTMTPEERMLERFTKERQHASKGVAFNLDDEEELTHYGQNLSKMDDFDDVGLTLHDDEDEPDQTSRDVVGKTHFGGFDDDDNDPDQPVRKKSKAEVMAEVMAKSKEHKLRRQMEREQGDNIRHELDEEFDSIRSLLYTQDPSSTGSNSVPLGRGRPELNESSSTANVAAGEENYDQHVRELAFDKRAKPKDRTKTEEELALEEKEALEKAERRRKRRMMGEESDSDGDEGRTKGKRKRERGADDLDDDFHEEETESNGLGAGLEQKMTGDDDEDSFGSEGEGEDDGEDGEDGDEEDDDHDGEDESDASDGEDGDPEDLIPTGKPGKKSSQAKDVSPELPFTYPCPATHEEFLEIIEDIQDKDVPTVVQRMRALYHPSLGPDNKAKLQTLTTVLIDHILFITSPPSPRFTLLSSIMPHLSALTRAYPIQSAEHLVEKLTLMHKNLKRGLSRGALDPDAKTWPGLPELCLLRTIGVLWSTSDMNHAVITPTRLLMGAYLGLARVRSLGDITSGLFLSTLFLQFEELSKRFVPEVVNFVVNTVLHLAPHDYEDVSLLPGSFPCPDLRSELCRPLRIDAKHVEGYLIQKPNLADILSRDTHDEQTKLDLLGLALDLLGRLAEMYKSLEGFIELFEPIAEILRGVDSQSLPESLRMKVTSLLDTTTRLLKFSKQARRPLLLQAHKPIPIPSYIPKFEANSSHLRRQDHDHERNEASKLRSQYKQERKGAIRELRKDARFLAGVEQKKQAERDREYNMKMKRAIGSLEGERAEEKAMEREKKRAEKRSGRK